MNQLDSIRTAAFFDIVASAARQMTIFGGWRVVGVRPDGVLVERAFFGRMHRRYVRAR